MNMFEANRNSSTTVLLGLQNTGREREKGLAYRIISHMDSVFMTLLL